MEVYGKIGGGKMEAVEDKPNEVRRKSINEKQYLVRGPKELDDIIESLCWDYVDGVKVVVKQRQQVIREAFVRGLKELQREKGVSL